MTGPVSREIVSPVSHHSKGMPLNGLARAGAFWTETEDDVLIFRAAKGLRFAWAAMKTGRSEAACRKRAHKIGIAKRIRRRTPRPEEGVRA